MSWDSADKRAKLVELRGRGLEWGVIGERLNESPDACSSKYRRLRLAGHVQAMERLLWEEKAAPTYDELAEEWNKWLGRQFVGAEPPTMRDNGRRRVGIICDTHCPYENRDVLATFVADGPYDLVVHGGDLLDWYAVSSFVKRKHVDPKLEVQHGTWVLETLAGIAAEVEVVSDNHSRRLLKAVSKANLPGELMELLQWFMPDLNLFKLMAEGLPNVKIADPVEVVEGVHFFGQYGDLVVGHADASSKLKLRAAENLDTWLREWQEPLGLKPWRVVAQAHTHQLGLAYGQGGHKAFMEIGACCTLEAMSYALTGKVGYRPPVPAYTTLEQVKEGDDWKTEFNSVRQIVVN